MPSCSEFPFNYHQRALLREEYSALKKKGLIKAMLPTLLSALLCQETRVGQAPSCGQVPVEQDTPFDPRHGPQIFDAYHQHHGNRHVYVGSFVCVSQSSFAPDTETLTAFKTPDGFYHYKVLPFGLHNSPEAFSRYLISLLAPYLSFARVYQDAIFLGRY